MESEHAKIVRTEHKDYTLYQIGDYTIKVNYCEDGPTIEEQLMAYLKLKLLSEEE